MNAKTGSESRGKKRLYAELRVSELGFNYYTFTDRLVRGSDKSIYKRGMIPLYQRSPGTGPVHLVTMGCLTRTAGLSIMADNLWNLGLGFFFH